MHKVATALKVGKCFLKQGYYYCTKKGKMPLEIVARATYRHQKLHGINCACRFPDSGFATKTCLRYNAVSGT